MSITKQNSIMVIIFLVLTSSALTIIAQQPDGDVKMQDVVYLKNGSIIRGEILEQVPGEHLKILLVNGCELLYQEDEIEKITKEEFKGLPCEGSSYKPTQDYRSPSQAGYPPTYYDPYYGPGRKSPGLAFLLSFIFPGVGQYYNGQVGKGFFQELLVFGGYTGAYFLYDHGDDALAVASFGAAGLATLWSWIDAPISAEKINRSLAEQQKYGHMLELPKERYVIGMDVFPYKDGVKGQLTIHF